MGCSVTRRRRNRIPPPLAAFSRPIFCPPLHGAWRRPTIWRPGAPACSSSSARLRAIAAACQLHLRRRKGRARHRGPGHRASLGADGARAVLIKPGFVDTPMTAGVARKGHPVVAARGHRGCHQEGRARRPIVYAPWWWRFIMLMIRLAPARILHRTKPALGSVGGRRRDRTERTPA